MLSFDDFELDPAASQLMRAGQPLKVDALVLDLLAYLAKRSGDLVTHEELIKHVWGGRAVSDNVVSVCVAKLRKALGHRRGERELIVNVYGRGYRFTPEVREVPRRSGDARRSEPPPVAIVTGGESAPFVGRETIMTRLRGALQAAHARKGRVCALLGEPGIGKTRTAETLEQDARGAGVNVVWGRTRDLEGAPPFWPWVEVLRELLDAVSIEGAQVHLGRSFVELSRVLPELRASADASDDDAARYRTFEAVARLLALAAEDAPWLIVLDDLHRADAASLELLSYLVEEIARLPVLIVVTLRSTERRVSTASQRRIEHVLGHRNCERIDVARLSQTDVTAFTAAFLGRADEALARAVFDKSEGNAFFMTELLREIGEGGPCPRDGQKVRELALPSAALDLVRQRVRRIGEDAHRTLQTAAVLGRSFDLALLSSVVSVPIAALLESLDDALATDLIVASPEGMGRFAFGHDLIRAVLYDSAPQLERAAFHLGVADVLAELSRQGKYVAPAELAHHYLSALPHGSAARAAEHAERAAQAAMDAAAYADAAAVLRRALAALDLAREPVPVLRCRLHYRMSICLRVSDARESIAELRRAVALAREHRLYALLALAGQAMVRAPGVVMIGDGRGVLEDALSGLPEDEHALRASALSHLAWCAPHCFDRAQCGALTVRALAHARASGSRIALVTALRTQIYLAGGPCRPEHETKRLLAEADELAKQEGHHFSVLWSSQAGALRALFALQRGDRAGLDRALDAMLQSATDLQHAEMIWHCERARLIDRMNRGALRDAEPLLAALRARGKAIQLFAYDVVCGNDLLVLRRQTAEHAKLSVRRAAPPLPEDPPGVLALKLRAALDIGQAEAARVIFNDFAHRGFDRLPCDRDYLGLLWHLALAAIAFEEHAPARELLELLTPYAGFYAADVSFHSDGSIAHILGLLSSLLERPEQAIALLEQAVERNERFELHARAAESRYELGRRLLRTGSVADRVRGTELLGKAQGTARALGLIPLAARIQDLL